MINKLVLIAMFLFVGSMVHAATITVPTQQATIQGAINAATDGDTISITDSATYPGELRIAKRVNIVAATGQTPKIQNSGTTNGTTIIFQPGSGGSQLGSLSGGRIKLELLKVTATPPAYNPGAFIQFYQTTDTLVTVENCDILETGTTAVGGINNIYQNLAICNQVALRYVDLDVNRTASGGVYGIILGTTSSIPFTSQGGPTFTLDHVRIKNYSRSGLWNNFRDTKINLSYCEFGVVGERQAALSYPWGGFISHQAPSRFTGTWANSVFRGGYNGSAAHIGGTGTSVTISRCVFVNQPGAAPAGPVGALQIGASAGLTLADSPRTTITADHCDFVDIAANTSTGRWAAIASRALPETTIVTTFTLNISNSNIFSAANKAVNLSLKPGATGDIFNSDHNNVFGATASSGYTAGTGDVSFDPLYFDAAICDMRYRNNSLKTADSQGKPVGSNGDYSDVFGQGIIPGTEGVINRAHDWTLMK